ncbi:MAG: hypothetical protein Ta2D_07480 [Rickettsiales bacterium]|nr:MAG: hypothetical protein Ta2D_07480 [Rickettsiales bacterium]
MSISSSTTINELIIAVRANSHNVVITTQPSAAPALADLIDQANIPGLLATVAGDNTLLAIPSDSANVSALLNELTNSSAATEVRTRLSDLTLSVTANAAGDVVVTTTESGAILVAELIDQSNVANVLGTVAGETAVLVSVSDPTQTANVVATLNKVLR